MEERSGSGCLTDQGVEVIASAAEHDVQPASELGLVTGSAGSMINY